MSLCWRTVAASSTPSGICSSDLDRPVSKREQEQLRTLARDMRRMSARYSSRPGARPNVVPSLWALAEGIDLMLKGRTVEVRPR